MPLFAFADITHHLRGKVAVPTDHYVDEVVIDSRKAGKGCLFVPLPGTQSDGHDHIRDAIERGCSACLVKTEKWEAIKAGVETAAKARGAGILLISSPLKGLQLLAKRHLEKCPDMVRIGVTGSNGKTTTKEIVGSILSRSDSTYVNEGNMNSDIGLPLAVLGMQSRFRFGVFEMGMNRKGEMAELADILQPHFALITNIGIAHIEYIGSRDKIAEEKKQIFRNFSDSDQGFLYEEETYLSFLKRSTRGRIHLYGPVHTAGYQGSADLGLDGTAIDWEGLQVHFPLFGAHNLRNALGAISLTSALGARPSEVKEGLESVAPLFGRSQVIRMGITVIQDCYNANPESMGSVLSFFEDLTWKGRKIAVLGSMLELGSETEPAHAALGRAVAGSNLDAVFFFGKEMKSAYLEAQDAKTKGNRFWTNDFDALLNKLRHVVRRGDALLIKGSRGVSLERLVSPLTKEAAIV